MLADDALYVACRESVPEVRSWFSWQRAATDAIAAISGGPAASAPSTAGLASALSSAPASTSAGLVEG